MNAMIESRVLLAKGREGLSAATQYRGSTAWFLLYRLCPNDVTSARRQGPYSGYFVLTFVQREEVVTLTVYYTSRDYPLSWEKVCACVVYQLLCSMIQHGFSQ